MVNPQKLRVSEGRLAAPPADVVSAADTVLSPPGSGRAARPRALQGFEEQSAQVAGLRDRQDDRVVARLSERSDHPEPCPRVGRGVAAELFETRLGHVVRAREREEAPPGL